MITELHILDRDLPSLHAFLLPKLPYMDLQNASSTITVLYAALLLIKELTSQQMRYKNRLMLKEFTGLLFPLYLEASSLTYQGIE